MGDTTGVAHVRLMKRHHVVALLAVLLAVVGGVGSVLGADAITHSNAEKSQQSFKSSSDEVASTLQLAIRQEDDLVVDTSGFLAGNSTASNAQFAQMGEVCARDGTVSRVGFYRLLSDRPSGRSTGFCCQSRNRSGWSVGCWWHVTGRTSGQPALLLSLSRCGVKEYSVGASGRHRSLRFWRQGRSAADT
jgi:hypothetical protein